MNKFYSSLLLMLILVGNAFGQCENDYDFGDVGFGVSPDASIGETFVNGEVGQEYWDVLHILVPEYASDVDPAYPPTLPVDSLYLDFVTLTDTVTLVEYSIEEMGLEVFCNNNGDSFNPCSFHGGEQYCATLQGVPSMSGVFQMNVHVVGFITIFETVEVPITFSTFILNVHCNLIEEPIITNADGNNGTLGSVDVTILDGVEVISFQWTNSDGLVVGSDEDIDGLFPGVYTLTIVTDACTSYFENILIEDNAVDCSSLDASYIVTDEIPGESLGGIDLSITGANGYPSCVWTDASGIIVGTDEDITNVTAGEYTVTITDEDGCILILEDIVVAVNSIDDVEINGVYLMPNPAKNLVSILLDYELQSNIDVRDARGRLVYSVQIIKNTVLDTSSWNEGIYFLSVSNELGRSTSRLVIKR